MSIEQCLTDENNARHALVALTARPQRELTSHAARESTELRWLELVAVGDELMVATWKEMQLSWDVVQHQELERAQVLWRCCNEDDCND